MFRVFSFHPREGGDLKLWIKKIPAFAGMTVSLLSLLLFISTTPAFASPQDDLAQTQKEAQEAEAKAKKLEEDARVLAQKSAELSAQMVKSAAALQASEARLSAIEEKMRILNEQITEKTNILTAHKKELAVMVQASIKLSQTPEEAIIIMPGNMMDNMKASRALKMTSDSIKKESEVIRTQMAELQALKEKVEKNKQEAISEQKDLEQKRIILKAQLDEHKALQKKLSQEQQDAKNRAQSLAKKASDLQDLISSLEEEKRQNDRKNKKQRSDSGYEIAADDSAPTGERGHLRSFKAAKGHIRVPAAGKLIQRFGTEARNETSKGITIATRPNAQVTAPFDAEVLFTGPFMEYGKVIILRHSDGFHTLLAGMTKIDVSVGDFLLEGEPIGAMGDSDSDNNLYMELRSSTHPIDPAGWVRGMNK